MCGIVGYVGPRQAKDVLLGGLLKLEYRGYDSAGVAVLDGGTGLSVLCRTGKVSELADQVQAAVMPGGVGIGHTRWATHGRPSEANAHPHRDCTGKIAVVHNGIIENFIELREQLTFEGHTFTSETDTEVVAHLLEKYYDGDLVEAMRKTVRRLEGAYALVAVHADHQGEIVVTRHDSPIVLGLGDGEVVVASDIPAVVDITRDVVFLEDGEIAFVTVDGVEVTDLDGAARTLEIVHIDWDIAAAERGGFDDFMLKEIHEQPRVIHDTLAGRVVDGEVRLSELTLTPEEIASIDRVYIIACGTSYHAGLVAKTLIEAWARIPVEVEVSSEFRYRDPIVTDTTLVIAITQSGETADTLAGIREARARGAKVFSVTNVVGSRVTRESDGVIYTKAGPEISVAATKSFTAQLAAIYVLALFLAQNKGRMSGEVVSELFDELNEIPAMVEHIISNPSPIEACAELCVDAPSALFIGRGVGAAVCAEGALKLKEISYLHAEAYPAGELKHGPIALVDDGIPVISVATASSTLDKTVSNIQEVRARGALTIAVATEGDETIERHNECVMRIPPVSELLSAIPAIVPLQMFARFVAIKRGCNVDQPRNLAKSVTVE